MSINEYIKGEIVHNKLDDSWAQFIEEIDGEIFLYNGLSYKNYDIQDIQKAELPLALDALGFRLHINEKKATEKFKYKGHIIDLIDGKYFIRGLEIQHTVDVQVAFNQFQLMSFKVIERRILSKI